MYTVKLESYSLHKEVNVTQMADTDLICKSYRNMQELLEKETQK